jgi:predicted enzyme related to lactoylglutathione lyase
MPRVIHFEISVQDVEKAIPFYETVFGWKVEKWDGPINYWLVTTGEEKDPGIDGAFMLQEGDFPPTVLTVEVPDIDPVLAQVEKNGGKVVIPKSPIPGVGYSAYFTDPQGVMMGVFQSDHTAH